MRLAHQRFALVLAIGLMTIATAIAEIDTTVISFVIPSQVAHQLSFYNSCSSSSIYFVENDTDLNGYQIGINATNDAPGQSFCQTTTDPMITINNEGSVAIDVWMNRTGVAGTNLSVSQAVTGMEMPCTGTSVADLATKCRYLPTNAILGIQVADNIAAQVGTETLWMWANMTNFNSGAQTSGIADNFFTAAFAN